MGIGHVVWPIVLAFLNTHPQYKGKLRLPPGGGGRTWEEQLSIVLQPKRRNQYLHIKKRFLDKYSDLNKLPEKVSDLDTEQKEWWRTEIEAQKDLLRGFPHVSGHAQDIAGIGSLKSDDKIELQEMLKAKRLFVFPEITSDPVRYGVDAKQATTFHVVTRKQR